MQTFYCFHQTPIGKLRLRATEAGLTAVDHVNQQETYDDTWIQDHEYHHLRKAKLELVEYFDNHRNTFTVPLVIEGTDFQTKVWNELCNIPYAKTISYQELAERIGNPKSVRAVGTTNGRNPLSIFIPCHRVIGKNGKLTGYAGGLDVKQFLLRHESPDFFA